MRPSAAPVALGVALAVAVAPAVVRADTPPTLWDLGKNPHAFEQRRLHLRVETDMEVAEDLARDPRVASREAVRGAVEDARVALESYRGPKDVWLRYDETWVAMQRGLWAAALPTLEALAKDFGDRAFSMNVWQRLAECYVRLERPADEIHAYDEVLARASTDRQRLTPLLNQGEAYMRSGQVDVAVAQFRRLLSLAARVPDAVELSLLAQWDLAVALDRSGDFRSGLEAARAAVHTTSAAMLLLSPINPSVYFVPDYERAWYLALGEEALALDATDARARADRLRAAESEMTSYVDGATQRGHDRWLSLARQRLDELRARRREADKHVPPPSPRL